MTAGKLTEDEFDVKDFFIRLACERASRPFADGLGEDEKKEAPDQGASVKLGFKQLT